jgi:hypothetical protein
MQTIRLESLGGTFWPQECWNRSIPNSEAFARGRQLPQPRRNTGKPTAKKSSAGRRKKK